VSIPGSQPQKLNGSQSVASTFLANCATVRGWTGKFLDPLGRHPFSRLPIPDTNRPARGAVEQAVLRSKVQITRIEQELDRNHPNFVIGRAFELNCPETASANSGQVEILIGCVFRGIVTGDFAEA